MKIFNWFLSLFSKPKLEPFPVPIIQPELEEPKMQKFITENDFDELAQEFNIEKAALKAIFTVEAGGKSGFLKEDPNIPVTLEEGHVFYKYIQNKHKNAAEIAKKYPDICYKSWTKQYYKTGLNEYKRYLKAAEIDEECAMLATSWGMGQCMGFNYKACGYNSVQEFVKAMYKSERNQCVILLNLITKCIKHYKTKISKRLHPYITVLVK